MRLMQHMFPQLLTEVPDAVFTVEGAVNPYAGAIRKSFDPFAVIGTIAGTVGGVITNGQNARTTQEVARQQTMQTDIMARSAAEQRAHNMAMLKYAAPLALAGLTIYILFR